MGPLWGQRVRECVHARDTTSAFSLLFSAHDTTATARGKEQTRNVVQWVRAWTLSGYGSKGQI
eukprot:3353279-Amphidinium_carterae.1